MYYSYDEKIAAAKKIIWENERIVCLLGVGMGIEAGLPNLSSNHANYYVEEKYDRAPEEILSASYFITRPRQFYDCYREICLSNKAVPTPAYYAIKQLEDWGKIKGCITQSIWSLGKHVGLRNLIELHGSIFDNQCPKCKKKFDRDFLLNSEGVPLCPECKSIIRPGIVLHGEQVRNDYITSAANMVTNADVLLILGTNMNDGLVQWAMPYFSGNKILLISKNEHYADKKANLVINDEIQKVMPILISK